MTTATHVTTGIQGLDSQLGGGFPAGSMVLLLADPSNAPYMFNDQFAAAGLARGETVLFYSLERPRDEVVGHLQTYLGKTPGPNLKFFDCYALKLGALSGPALKKLGLGSPAANVTKDVVDRLLGAPAKPALRVVIESLSEAIRAYGLDAAMNMVRQLSGVVQRLGATCSVLLVKGMHDHAVETTARHLADGVIEFGLDRQGFGLYAYISIAKMRGIPDATRLLLYKETEKGLWLESTRRVF